MVVARWVMVVVRCKMMNSWMIFYLTDGKVFCFQWRYILVGVTVSGQG